MIADDGLSRNLYVIIEDVESKLKYLKQYILSLGQPAVAFSGGVDSTFLLKVAQEVLGDKLLAITAKSIFFPEREIGEAVEFCKKEGIRHSVIEIDIKDEVAKNPLNRCYLCKKDMFERFLQFSDIIMEGSNIDDTKDYRPGMQAIKELGVKSPLMEAGLTKEEIRVLSRKLNLPTSEKPSFACLASRFVYGEKITPERLKMVDAAEEYLLNKGLHQVRVRIHNDIARIEALPFEFEKILAARTEIVDKLKELGFNYVTMDLYGYKTGSMKVEK